MFESQFIVVGAGSSGAAVAGRLAERGCQVTLLEAGPDWRSEELVPEHRHPRADVFAWKVGGAWPERMAWSGLTARRKPTDEATPYLRGRGLGGTSTINGLVVIRPPMEEFADWVAMGCSGWGPDDVLPYFVRAEDDLDYGDEPYHGRGGPTPVVRRDDGAWGTADEILRSAAMAVGHAWSPDHNRPGALGVSRTATMIRMGVRVTTNDGYLEPFRSRQNLTVIGDALVDRVLFDGRAAVGVRAMVGGGWRDLRGGTVVLCAGAASSPAILQRSGVGPGHLLRDLVIPEVCELPVGEGVQDHVGFWLAVGMTRPRASATGARGNCTLRYTTGTPEFGVGDLLMVAANALESSPREGAVGVKLAQCFSRGTSAVTSRDAQVAPAISMALLTDERDRALGRRAVRDALELLRGQEVAGDVAWVRDKYGRDFPSSPTDGGIDTWLEEIATDTSHLSGGARMGDPADATTVVDPGLRVLGTEGLYVADMSVVPTVPRANTHLTAVMIGERAADLLCPNNSRARSLR